ncbi:hypothetical protein VPH35_000264 [Triticum aestivum]
MLAVQYSSCGGGVNDLKHVQVPVPSANKNEVLIRVEAASINPIDWKTQDGKLWPLLPRTLPLIPLTDIAGVVVDVGPDVQHVTAGDEVVAMLHPFRGGGFAEYAVASANLTVKRPPEVSAAEGAGLPVAAASALQALRCTGAKFDGRSSQPPLHVLLTAASGGVGLYAVQLAKLANLHVAATCGARNMELVKSLGAEEVLDYNTPEGASLKSTSGKKYDGVVHCTVGIGWSTFAPLLCSSGKLIDLTPNFSAYATSLLHLVTFSRKRLVPLLLRPNKADLEFLVGLVKARKLKTVIDSRYPFSDAARAWQTAMAGHATGKIIIDMGT